jgi:hypothetical protein
MRIVLLLTLLIPIVSLAQGPAPEPKANSVDPGAEIYNGKMHVIYPSAVSGCAYFLNQDWQPGSIMYHEIYYPSVWLKYDLVKKEVIIQHSNGLTPIILFTPRIQFFTLADKEFIHVKENDTLNLPAGIYQKIGTGLMGLYINRFKFLEEQVTQNGIERKFYEKNKFYIVKDGVSSNIRNKRDVWILTKDKKSAIRNDLKRKKLKFRKQPEATLIEIAKYYNEAGK